MKKRTLWLVGLLCGQVLATPPQVVLNVAPSRPDRKLHGRFLHITDIHPDPYYEKGTSQSSQCHRKEPDKDQKAGYYGTPFGSVKVTPFVAYPNPTTFLQHLRLALDLDEFYIRASRGPLEL
jgi:endopolyphosphatase